MADQRIALVLHGGAGPVRDAPVEREITFLQALVARGGEMLGAGASALDVVVEMARAMERCGLFVAGKGSSPNRAGAWELDAAVMDGARRKAGAVAALEGFESPIEVARAVMERTPHVLLVGAGASAFAAEHGFSRIEDPADYYTPASRYAPGSPDELASGTVGAVARDRLGRLAVATSTGGVLGKIPGRVGDAPIIGAGSWADERVAVSCTGQGEYFMRAAVAADVSARIRYGGASLQDAVAGALDDMRRQGGYGGLIAVDARGAIAMPFIAESMRRAWLDEAGAARAAVY